MTLFPKPSFPNLKNDISGTNFISWWRVRVTTPQSVKVEPLLVKYRWKKYTYRGWWTLLFTPFGPGSEGLLVRIWRYFDDCARWYAAVVLLRYASGRGWHGRGLHGGCMGVSGTESVCPSIGLSVHQHIRVKWPKPERVPRNTHLTHVNLKELIAHVFPLCYLTSSTPSNTYGQRREYVTLQLVWSSLLEHISIFLMDVLWTF